MIGAGAISMQGRKRASLVSGTAYRYFRFWNTDGNQSFEYLLLYEMEVHTTIGGADVCNGGTASGTFSNGGGTKAFDNDLATWVGTTNNQNGKYIMYDLGVGNEVVAVEFSMKQSDSDRNSRVWRFEGSNDGTNFDILMTEADVSGGTGAAFWDGTLQDFELPAVPA